MATDLERLIVTIEANTKQFTSAMKALAKTTDVAMGGVQNAVRAGGQRIEHEMALTGAKAAHEFQKELAKSLFGISRGGITGLAGLLLGDFIKDSIDVAAKAGSESAKVFIAQFEGARSQAQGALGSFLSFVWLANQRVLTMAGVPGGQLIEDQMTALDTEKKRLEIEQRRTTTLTKNVELTEQESNILEKANKLGYKEPPTPAKPELPRLGPLQAPGAEELAAFDKVMKNLIFEERQLGRTAAEQQVYNELKKAGVNRASEFGQAIELTTRQLYEEELQLQALKEANDGLEASSKTFIQGLVDGQSAAEAFSAALRKMADVLLDMALHNLFNPGGTPLLQNLFGNMLGLGQWTGGVLPGSNVPGAQYGAHFKVGGVGGTDSKLVAFRATPGETVDVHNHSLGGGAGRMGGGMTVQHNTNINVSGSVDQKTLAAMNGMIQRNNAKQNAELQRNWGNLQARYHNLRGP